MSDTISQEMNLGERLASNIAPFQPFVQAYLDYRSSKNDSKRVESSNPDRQGQEQIKDQTSGNLNQDLGKSSEIMIFGRSFSSDGVKYTAIAAGVLLAGLILFKAVK